MSDFKQRLEAELDDLTTKINRLGDFIFTEEYNKIEEIQEKLLSVQYLAMKTYHQCLSLRLLDLNKKDTKNNNMKKNRFKKHEWTVQGIGNQTLKIVYRDGKVEYTKPVVVNDKLYASSILADKGESILSIENVTKGKLVYPA